MAVKIFDEEKYQQNKKKMSKIGKIIAISSLIVGLVMIITSIILMNTNNSTVPVSTGAKLSTEAPANNVAAPKTQEEFDASVATVESQYDKSLADDIASKTAEINARDFSSWGSMAADVKQSEIDSQTKLLTMSSDGDKEHAIAKLESDWDESKSAYELQQRQIAGSKDMQALEDKGSVIQDKAFAIFGQTEDMANDAIYYGLIATGIMIIVIGGGAGLVIILLSKGRSILGFAAQTTVPVTNAVIKETAPVIGEAAGTVAKGAASGIGEIAKAVKEGIVGDSGKKKK